MGSSKRMRVEDESADAIVAKATKSQIQKVVKKTLFRNCEVKGLQALTTGTVQADNASPFGNTIACPIPTAGAANGSRVGDKIRIIQWEVDVTFTQGTTVDRLRLSMCCKKNNGQAAATIPYNEVYGVSSGSPAVALMQPDNHDEITEYNDHQFALSAVDQGTIGYKRVHKFKYPLTMAFGGNTGTSADVIRNLLFVAFAGDVAASMSTYQVQQRILYIDA